MLQNKENDDVKSFPNSFFIPLYSMIKMEKINRKKNIIITICVAFNMSQRKVLIDVTLKKDNCHLRLTQSPKKCISLDFFHKKHSLAGTTKKDKARFSKNLGLGLG